MTVFPLPSMLFIAFHVSFLKLLFIELGFGRHNSWFNSIFYCSEFGAIGYWTFWIFSLYFMFFPKQRFNFCYVRLINIVLLYFTWYNWTTAIKYIANHTSKFIVGAFSIPDALRSFPVTIILKWWNQSSKTQLIDLTSLNFYIATTVLCSPTFWKRNKRSKVIWNHSRRHEIIASSHLLINILSIWEAEWVETLVGRNMTGNIPYVDISVKKIMRSRCFPFKSINIKVPVKHNLALIAISYIGQTSWILSKNSPTPAEGGL